MEGMAETKMEQRGHILIGSSRQLAYLLIPRPEGWTRCSGGKRGDKYAGVHGGEVKGISAVK